MISIFISYSHTDSTQEVEARTTLAPLVREGRIQVYSDQNLRAGQKIRSTNDQKLLDSDVVLFLLTRAFISSDECLREWQLAKEPKESGFERRRIPVLINDCPWRDLLQGEDLLVIPNDAKSLASYSNSELAWTEIYGEIKTIISDIETTCTPRPKFLEFLEETEIIGDHQVSLSKNYVFGRVQSYDRTGVDELNSLEGSIRNLDEILKRSGAIVHGEPMSGKTALAKMLCINQIEHDRPVLYIDAKKQTQRWTLRELERIFKDQFFGSWDYWLNQPNKVVVIDDLGEDKDAVKFLENKKDYFAHVIITMDTDIYRTYYHADSRVHFYSEMEIKEINRWHQEQLIRNTLKQTRGSDVTDGDVDIVERKIDEIVDTRLIPRYPFHVLSVIQALQVFMPQDTRITSHAHCYYIFILSRLIKAGVEKDDGSINACLNFAEHFAKAVFDQRERDQSLNADFFRCFVHSYQSRFVVSDEQIRRMCHPRYGIIHEEEGFRVRYMEFYFLGRFLARNSKEQASIIQRMCDCSEVERYHLTLLFIIHHADNTEILESITLTTMCALEKIEPATLHRSETNRFQTLVAKLNKNLLTNRSVQEHRRESRDVENSSDDSHEENQEYSPNEILKVLKNNRILGQVLRTRHGNIEKPNIKDIIIAVADGGLRVVNVLLSSGEEIESFARIIQTKFSKAPLETIRKELTWISFIWTMINIEKIVESVNKGEIHDILKEIVHEKDTPAYELINYFSQLDNAGELTSRLHDHFVNLCKRQRDPFIRRVAAIRTQFYMNTHTSKRQIEQRFCESMGIKYIYRRDRN